MAEYQKFLNDFPDRCLEILRKFQKPAEMEGLEVTMMLSIASAAFVIAFESIRDANILTDARLQLSGKAIADFEQLLAEDFLTSRIKPNGNWALERYYPNTMPPWSNGGFNVTPSIPPNASVFYILDLLRNGLGHGNIQTYSTNGSSIDLLVFIVWARKHVQKTPGNKSAADRSVPQKYDMIAVSPIDLLTFLTKWLTYLRELDATKINEAS